MQELSARWHWACPLWNTEDAAHAVAHACGAAYPVHGAVVRCGEGVPCGNSPHALGECSACRDCGAGPPRDSCLFHSALESILAGTTPVLAMIRRRSITSAVQTAGLGGLSSQLLLSVSSSPSLPFPPLLCFSFHQGRDVIHQNPPLQRWVDFSVTSLKACCSTIRRSEQLHSGSWQDGRHGLERLRQTSFEVYPPLVLEVTAQHSQDLSWETEHASPKPGPQGGTRSKASAKSRTNAAAT